MLKEKAKDEVLAIGAAVATIALTFAAFAVVVSKMVLHLPDQDAIDEPGAADDHLDAA